MPKFDDSELMSEGVMMKWKGRVIVNRWGQGGVEGVIVKWRDHLGMDGGVLSSGGDHCGVEGIIVE